MQASKLQMGYHRSMLFCLHRNEGDVQCRASLRESINRSIEIVMLLLYTPTESRCQRPHAVRLLYYPFDIRVDDRKLDKSFFFSFPKQKHKVDQKNKNKRVSPFSFYVYRYVTRILMTKSFSAWRVHAGTNRELAMNHSCVSIYNDSLGHVEIKSFKKNLFYIFYFYLIIYEISIGSGELYNLKRERNPLLLDRRLISFKLKLGLQHHIERPHTGRFI